MSKPMGSLPSEPMEVMAADANASEAKVKGNRKYSLYLMAINGEFVGGLGARPHRI